MKVLLVEDDSNLLNDIKAQLEHHGFEVAPVFDGLLAERIILKNRFDCIVLDVNLPGKNGFDLCRTIRKEGISTPVILLTAFSDIDDKLEGFDSGADDYLTKPFLFQELYARIKALIKRGEIYREQKNIHISDLEIDLNKKVVLRAGMPVKLTPREFDILVMMAEARGNPVPKKEMIRQLWGTSVEINTNTIEVFINFLRTKIDKDHVIKLIHTRQGFGYYLSDTLHEA